VSAVTALTGDDFAYALCRHAYVFSEAIFCQAKWPEELFIKHLPGRDRWNGAHGFFSLVIVDDFSVYRSV
jgi:hypothetical protein